MNSRTVLAAFLLLASPVTAWSQDGVVPTAAQVPAPYIQQQASQIPAPPQSQQKILLEQKLAELNRLQKEVDDLRAATGIASQILVRIQVLEVNLTKVQRLKIDFSSASGGALHSADIYKLFTSGGLAAPNAHRVGYTQLDESDTNALLAMLCQKNLAKELTSPTMVVASGRPALFNVGGEFPVPTPQLDSAEFHQFGTQVDLLAQTLGNGMVRLNVRPRISELDMTHAIKVGGTQVPALTVRQCDFSTEVKFGQTAILSGMVQSRMAEVKGAKASEPVEMGLVVTVKPEAVDPIAKTNDPPTLHRIGNRLFAPPATP